MPKISKIYFLIILLCSAGFFLQAQNANKVISGKVSDEKGNPLQGATITVANAKKANTLIPHP